MVKDPNRLHSEEFQTRARALDFISSKGGPITFNPLDLQSITNPSYTKLPNPGSQKSEDDE